MCKKCVKKMNVINFLNKLLMTGIKLMSSDLSNFKHVSKNFEVLKMYQLYFQIIFYKYEIFLIQPCWKKYTK